MLNDTVVVVADCDSLERKVEYYRQEVEMLKGLEEVSEERREPPPVSRWKWFFIGFLSGVAVLVFLVVAVKRFFC